METLIETDTPVVGKTKELCQTIVEQAGFSKLFSHVEAFMNDTEAQNLYDHVRMKQDELYSRQQQGEKLPEADIEAFEKQRDELMNNSVVNNFFDAQQQMQKVQQTVNDYIGKTFELGRIPEDHELSSSGGCCGGGCGSSGGGCG